MILYAILNILCVVLSFFIISQKRVPNLKNHYVGMVSLQVFVGTSLMVGLAFFFDVPIVVFRRPIPPDEVVQLGVPISLTFFVVALSYFGIQHLRHWWKSRR